MLIRMKVQLIHQKSIWGSRTWLRMAPVWHLIFSGPIGASALGHCAVHADRSLVSSGFAGRWWRWRKRWIQPFRWISYVSLPLQRFLPWLLCLKLSAEKSACGFIPWGLYLQLLGLCNGGPLPTPASPENLPICVGGSSERETLFHPGNEQSGIRWPLLGSSHRNQGQSKAEEDHHLLQLKQGRVSAELQISYVLVHWLLELN